MKAFLSIVFFCCLFFSSFAQNESTIRGVVTDKSNQENLAFVNIGIEGTLIGTASNSYGEFMLSIPAEHVNKKLFFSAIGFQNLLIPISSYVDNSVVQLEPLSYGIGDVEISTQSKVWYKIVRDAAAAIPENFTNTAFQYKLLYQNEIYQNRILTRKRDATVLLSDATGYGDRQNAFGDRNYRILNVQRNFDVKSLADGTTSIDELLTFDFARTPGNILETAYLNEYDLELVTHSTVGSDSVWVIGYQLARPDISKTGDIYATKYEGRLYISKSKHILLKAETHIQSDIQSPINRNVATEKQLANKSVDYHVTTTYKSTEQGYSLDRIALNKSYVDPTGISTKQSASLLVLDENRTNPTLLESRQYFEDMVSDPDFWIGIKE